MEDFGLCLTLDVFQSGAPGVEDFGLCLTLDVGQSGAPGVEDFSLWLTLDELTAPCPSRRSLSLCTGRALVGLGRIDSPLPLAEVFVALDWLYIWSVNGRTHGRSRNARERFVR